MTNNQKKGLVVFIALLPFFVGMGISLSWWAPFALVGGFVAIFFWLWFCLEFLSKKLGVED